MKRILLICVMTLAVFATAIASINEKLSGTTQLFIAERDGLISLDMNLDGPKMFSRPPLLRSQPVERLIAAPEDHHGVKVVPAFIHIDPNRTSKIESMGVIVQERFNGFVTALIPVDLIERVAEVTEVKEINVARKMKLRTNQARYYTNADDVINYSNDAITAGLPQAFKGSGVVVGVIDDGIDFQHMMFRDASGNYRIKRAYVARSSSSFTTYTSITSSSPTTDDSGESHGTHTSSTAAGREITASGTTYGGMAPEADLVLVGCGSYLYNTNIANGIKYVFDYADSQNMPAVCSISLGSHMGPHDGTGELSSIYTQYAGSNPNHIIVYAAGNEAGGDYGTVYSGSSTSSSSSPFTTVLRGAYYAMYYGSTSYLNRLYYGYDVFYARTANKALACKLHVVNTSDNSIVWTSSAITSSTSSVSGITTYFNRSPSVTITRDSYSNKYYVQLYFNQMTKNSSYNSSNYVLAVSVYPTSGSCGIDAWDVNGYNAFGPTSGSIGGYTFVAGSDDASVGDEGCSDDVISVGAYVSKTSVRDYNNSNHNLSYYTLNDIAYFSSYQAQGCGATGVTKPDICAPGATVVAGINHYDTQGMMANALSSYGYYLVYNSTNSSLGSMDGTSMATPCAAGIIALYLQAAKYAGKTLNTEGIRDVFANTAITDSYTTKKNFGLYGKIDALAGVKYILGGASVDPTLTVDPTSLSFTGNVGQTYTKTFTLSGAHLTSGVNLSVSGTGYSVSPTSLTAAQAQAGATITVTYTPTAAGTHTGTVTASSTGASNVTVALTGTATNAPALTATPSSLSFSTTVGTSVVKTFRVVGTDLTGNVSLSVSGTGYSIDKTSITRTQATSGSTVTVTYNPTAAGTHTGTVTITSTGAETVTVPLNGTATEVVRTITVSPTSLTFNSTAGVAVTQTFNVKGSNLSGDLTLTLNNANGIYSIDRTSITAAQAQSTNGENVTVTYNPTVAGNSNASVTISGGGAESQTVTLSGTAVTPTITANPTSLSFNCTEGETVTQTFTLSGANLTGNLTLALNDPNGVYAISSTSVSANQAASGVSVTVTYHPTAAGTHSGTVTISGGGAQPVTVNLNGNAAEPPRTITASTDVVNISTIAGETATATFTVIGQNLTGALTLALNDANGVYSIQPSTISAAEAAQGVTVTVTYNPAAFGNHTASIVISGGGANPVTVNLNGTANIIKYAPVMLEANDAYVALTRFRAEWTDETPTYNVQSYTLEVNAKPTEPELPAYVEVGNADFSSLTAVTNTSGSYTNQINNASTYLPTGWSATTYLYIDDGAVVSRAYNSNYATIVSPTYDFTGYDKVTVVVNVLRFNADDYTDAIVEIASSMGSQEITFSNTSDYTTFTVVLDVAQSDRITLTTLQSCYALHDITIYAGDLTAAQNLLMASETGGADYRLIEGIDPGTFFYTVKDLTAGGTFLYRVKALYIDGTESDWSNIEEVTLHENDHPYMLGDVNHDDHVDVDDVSIIIGYVLGKPGYDPCPICADINDDGLVDIDDVAIVINMALGKYQPATVRKASPMTSMMKYFDPAD